MTQAPRLTIKGQLLAIPVGSMREVYGAEASVRVVAATLNVQHQLELSCSRIPGRVGVMQVTNYASGQRPPQELIRPARSHLPRIAPGESIELQWTADTLDRLRNQAHYWEQKLGTKFTIKRIPHCLIRVSRAPDQAVPPRTMLSLYPFETTPVGHVLDVRSEHAASDRIIRDEVQRRTGLRCHVGRYPNGDYWVKIVQ